MAFSKNIPLLLICLSQSMIGPFLYPTIIQLQLSTLISRELLILYPMLNSSISSLDMAYMVILLSWISYFLSNRTQRVRVGSSLSYPCTITSGIPQGSVIGPLLFNLFINDISDIIDPTSTIKIFADDVKIYTDISSFPGSFMDRQTNLDHIYQWSHLWQLPISHSKCDSLILGHADLPSPLHLSNIPIPCSSRIVDLGIAFDPCLDFKNHIFDIVTRAKQRAALIHRCFISRDISILVKAFTTYVRPLLEYAPQIWSPHHITLINSIESVQRSFTKRLPGFLNKSYQERLTLLNLQSLEHRRLIHDLILCYNIIHNRIAITQNDFFQLSNKQIR